MIKPAAVLGNVRQRRPFIDHLVRAFDRYTADTGGRLAAAVTFYWFLSLFPILLVAVWITSLVLGDTAGQEVTSGLRKVLPAQLAQTIGDVVDENAGQAGLVGLAGLLVSGLGWIDALREAIRTMWHQNVTAGNLVMRKVFDVISLVGLFGVIAASVIFSAAATAATGDVLDLVGLEETTSKAILINLLGYALGAVVDTVVFLYLFTRLPRVRTPIRAVLKGAIFGAVGFEVLKFVGAFYVARTTSRGEATYGTFAVVVGLLLFLNLVSRLILFAAAFAVTAPYDTDVAPSGTADRELARKAGIPEEYADRDLNLQEQGAPTPLRAAVQGKTPSQDQPEGRGAAMNKATEAATAALTAAAVTAVPERSWGPREQPVAVPPTAVPAPAAVQELPPGAATVQLAARVTAAVMGLALTAVGVYAVRSVTRVLRR